MHLQSAIYAMWMGPEWRGGYPIAMKSPIATHTIPDDWSHARKLMGDMEETLMGVVPVKLTPSTVWVAKSHPITEVID